MNWKAATLAIGSIALLAACDGKGMHPGKVHKNVRGAQAHAISTALSACGDLTEAIVGGTPAPTANKSKRPSVPITTCLSAEKLAKCLNSQKGVISVSTYNLDLGEPDLEGTHFRPLDNDALKAKMLLKDHADLFVNEYLDASQSPDGDALSQDPKIGVAFKSPVQTGCSQATLGNQTYTIVKGSSSTLLHLSSRDQIPVREIYYTLLGNSVRVTYYTQETEKACDGSVADVTLRQSYLLGMGENLADVPMAVSLAQFLGKHVNVSPEFSSKIPKPDQKQKGVRVSTDAILKPKTYFYAVTQIEKGNVTGASCQAPPKQ